MAARLTDKQKKKIIADYVELGSYNAVAKKHKVSVDTVKRTVLQDNEIVKKTKQKKEQNSVSILEHMESQKDIVNEILTKGLRILNDDEKLKTANPAQITTAMGTLIDKYTAVNSKTGNNGNGNAAKAWALLFSAVSKAYPQVLWDIINHNHTDYDFPGGRGSLKSSFVSLVVVMLVISNPDYNALVLRKVSNTIRDSVFAQYMWAIEKLGLAEDWDSKVSPPELIYKPTGQRILFRGADDPMKLKSVKVAKGYIAVTHFEEKDQFAGRKEIRSILQSTRRGGDLFWNFESYNPPISRDNWANKDSAEEHAGRLVHRTTYLEAPAEWLGEQFINDAEELKARDERAYRHEYLGEAVGTGGNVFENLELREITDAEVKSFDRIFQGADWGWFPDPFAFVRVHYDKARETIYLLDEIYENKLTNEESAKQVKERKYNDTYITCDSAEPKSIADWRALGIPAKAAVKGPGSVDYGMKWLQKRKIVIDRKRTPHAYDEFVNYEYERTKDGEIISGYPDENNHTIDALRYALERVYNKYGSNA